MCFTLIQEFCSLGFADIQNLFAGLPSSLVNHLPHAITARVLRVWSLWFAVWAFTLTVDPSLLELQNVILQALTGWNV